MQLGNRHNQASFAQVPQVNMARSKFNRSFAAKDTFDFDYLIPFFADEIIPGDTVNLNVASFIRLASQQVPVMDNMYIDFFFFFVPNRLVWDNFEKFMGAQDNPGDSTSYLVPKITSPVGGFLNGTIYDKFGLPTQIPGIAINALPFRGYYRIWNEWFRDENVETSLTFSKGDGPDLPTSYFLQLRNKRPDYFTTALPWPQKGSAISLPIGSTAPIIQTGTNPAKWDIASTGALNTIASTIANDPANGNIINNTGALPLQLNPNGSLIADLSTATAATINQFRQAIMMQSLLELDARGGTRYVEILKAHFNVTSPDFRLQRTEYLAGGTTQITQHPVPQTSETNETPQGNLAAFATAQTSGNKIGFTKSFVEHGWVIGMCQARADITYQQGINRKWSRSTRWDYFWPKLQETGEQAILTKEIYAVGTSGGQTDNIVFGYQEKDADYKYHPSEIRGQFRSNFAQTLQVWHLSQYFNAPPALNDSFLLSNTPIERVLAVTEGYPHLKADFFFNYIHARPMVTKAVPATLGRF